MTANMAPNPTVVDNLRSAHSRNRRLERKNATVNRELSAMRTAYNELALKYQTAQAILNADESAHRRVKMLDQRLDLIRTLTQIDSEVRIGDSRYPNVRDWPCYEGAAK